MKQYLQIHSAEEMRKFGTLLGTILQPKTTILLSGDLGAGKTTLSQSIAKGLCVTERVSSPTFTIVKEYESGRLPLYHIDAYRLESGDDIGIDEYFLLQGVTIIEWPSMIQESLPEKVIEIEIFYQGDGREIQLSTSDKRYEAIMQKIVKQYQQEMSDSFEKINN